MSAIGKEILRNELIEFAKTLVNGYVENSTILEILGTTDCIDDYVDNQLRERWEKPTSEPDKALGLFGVSPCTPDDFVILCKPNYLAKDGSIKKAIEKYTEHGHTWLAPTSDMYKGKKKCMGSFLTEFETRNYEESI